MNIKNNAKPLILVLSMMMIFGGCSQQSNLNNVNKLNACAILKAKPQWANDLKKAYQQSHIPPNFILSVIYQESRFKPYAKSQTTSSDGYAQATKATWQRFEKAKNQTKAKNNFKANVAFINWYMSLLKDQFNLAWAQQKQLYLAYMKGGGSYAKAINNTNGENTQKWQSQAKIAQKVSYISLMYRFQLQNCDAINIQI